MHERPLSNCYIRPSLPLFEILRGWNFQKTEKEYLRGRKSATHAKLNKLIKISLTASIKSNLENLGVFISNTNRSQNILPPLHFN